MKGLKCYAFSPLARALPPRATSEVSQSLSAACYFARALRFIYCRFHHFQYFLAPMIRVVRITDWISLFSPLNLSLIQFNPPKKSPRKYRNCPRYSPAKSALASRLVLPHYVLLSSSKLFSRLKITTQYYELFFSCTLMQQATSLPQSIIDWLKVNLMLSPCRVVQIPS